MYDTVNSLLTRFSPSRSTKHRDQGSSFFTMSTNHNYIQPPCFASANNNNGGGRNGEPPAWLMEGSDPLDVDLLAEYLLDDGKQAPSGMTFDFK